MITRRKFIGHAATGLAAAYLPASLVHAGRAGGDRPRGVLKRFRRGGQLGRESFEALVDEIFYVYGGPAGVVDLRLASVTDGPSSRSVEQFYLDFRGPSSPSLESGTYEIEHSRSARFQIYLENAGSDSEASYYSASFSLVSG